MQTPDFDAVNQILYSPGAPFEITSEEVLGEKLPVFKNRHRSLREMLEATAEHADDEYIVHGDRRITYGEHLRLVASTTQALSDRYGVGPGDRVAIFSENRPEWIVVYWATVSLGAIATAINGWWTQDEAVYGIGKTEPKILIGDRKRLARLEGVDVGCPIVDIETEGEALLGHAPDASLPTTPIGEDDPATILFTSGTTGRPKCALASHRGIVGFVQAATATSARGVVLSYQSGYEPEKDPPPHSALLTVPLFHLSGLYAGAIMNLSLGAKTIWRSGRFDPIDVLRLMEKERVTSWSGIGSMAPQVLNHPDIDRYDLGTLRNLGSGGAPTSPTLLARMAEVVPNGIQGRGLGYGLSESVASLSQISGIELEDRPTSVGRAAATCDIEIRDESGNALPEGEQGEVFGRSAYVMLEYWRNPEATAETIHPGRWLATGDIGHLQDGYLFINSRARDMILRAGENIYPIEIEHRLEAHPNVRESAVIGVDHPELGQEVKAIVVPEPGAEVDSEALDAFCRETLSPYKIPAHWDIRSEPLPRNASGKILKNVLSGEVENALVDE
jgi:long-chain acyl-CoA synthetase